MNALDYLKWRGDLPMAAIPFCEVDALVLAVFSYLDILSGASGRNDLQLSELDLSLVRNVSNSPSYDARLKLLKWMQFSKRFGSLRLHHYVDLLDKAREMQFSAVCVDLPGNVTCVVFRGTDNTMIGWREDFNMSFESPVPSQEAAVIYTERMASVSDRKLCLIGHSKGGNLATYAACHVPADVREKCAWIYCFDGPGLDEETLKSEGYQAVRDRIFSFVPQTSIIGMLMGYHEHYTVVRSGASGLYQHDPLTWQVEGPAFLREKDVNRSSDFINETLHEWLAVCTKAQRETFVDALFELMGEAEHMSEITRENKLKLTMNLVNATIGMEPEKRRQFLKLLGQFVAVGAINVLELLQPDKDGKDKDGRDKDSKDKDSKDKDSKGKDSNALDEPEKRLPEA